MKYVDSNLERFRRFIAIVSIVASSNYLIWRASTLNYEDLWFSLILYFAEIYSFFTGLLFFFMVWRLPIREYTPPDPSLKVDVFITTYNEDLSILKQTIIGCINIRYPHKTYVLDDGNREEVKKLCEKLGVGYISRTNNVHAKAGNLNNALKHTDGDFIAIFDADHVPQPDFLDKTLGYFKDEKVAFVQTPQEFYNVDSFQHINVGGKLWHEQSLFYRIIQWGKDRVNSAFLCGTCAVLRRKALEDIGGFATGTVAEDLHTSLKLHMRGWKSVYHPEPLAYGISPNGAHPYKVQRERWGMGAMQVLMKEKPFFKKGLTFYQKLSYLASIIVYFDGFKKLIYYISPILVLLFGIYPIEAYASEFLPRYIPHFVFSIWAFEEMSRGYGRFLFIELFNMARFTPFMKSVIAFLKLNRVKFKVTEKRININESINESIPQIFILILSTIGIIYGILNMNNTTKDIYYANIFWASFNMSLAIGYIILVIKKKNRRNLYRFNAYLPVSIIHNNSELPSVLLDIHEKGAAVLIPNSKTNLNIDETLSLKIYFGHIGVLIEGKVRYKFINGYYSKIGLSFINVSEDQEDFIIRIKFVFLLKYFMKMIDKPSRTPLEIIFDLIKGKLIKEILRPEKTSLTAAFINNGTYKFPVILENKNGGDVVYLLSPLRLGNCSGISVELDGLNARMHIIAAKEESFNGYKLYKYVCTYSLPEELVESVKVA